MKRKSWLAARSSIKNETLVKHSHYCVTLIIGNKADTHKNILTNGDFFWMWQQQWKKANVKFALSVCALVRAVHFQMVFFLFISLRRKKRTNSNGNNPLLLTHFVELSQPMILSCLPLLFVVVILLLKSISCGEFTLFHVTMDSIGTTNALCSRWLCIKKLKVENKFMHTKLRICCDKQKELALKMAREKNAGSTKLTLSNIAKRDNNKGRENFHVTFMFWSNCVCGAKKKETMRSEHSVNIKMLFS